jgi:hypothetical protein
MKALNPTPILLTISLLALQSIAAENAGVEEECFLRINRSEIPEERIRDVAIGLAKKFHDKRIRTSTFVQFWEGMDIRYRPLIGVRGSPMRSPHARIGRVGHRWFDDVYLSVKDIESNIVIDKIQIEGCEYFSKVRGYINPTIGLRAASGDSIDSETYVTLKDDRAINMEKLEIGRLYELSLQSDSGNRCSDSPRRHPWFVVVKAPVTRGEEAIRLVRMANAIILKDRQSAERLYRKALTLLPEMKSAREGLERVMRYGK